jgi:hypothetical protein
MKKHHPSFKENLMSDNNATSTDVETFETPEVSTKTQTVANIAVLSFAVIGAVQTTKFVIVNVKAGIAAVKKARAEQEPTVAHAATPTE